MNPVEAKLIDEILAAIEALVADLRKLLHVKKLKPRTITVKITIQQIEKK